MKNLLRFCLFLLVLFSCQEGILPEQKTPEELALESLAGSKGITYSLGSNGFVKRNDIDESIYYSKINIKFLPKNKLYEITGAGELFDSNGSWEFVGLNFDKIILSGTKLGSKIEISYTKKQKI